MMKPIRQSSESQSNTVIRRTQQRRTRTGQKHNCANRSRGNVPHVPRSKRHGVSLIIVMLAISMTLALTYGFVRTQVTSVQLTQNNLRRDLAMEAARTGVSIALKRMQAANWVGTSEIYTSVLINDSTNKTECRVTYSPVTSGQIAGVADIELPLHLCVTSTGTWSSPTDSTIRATGTVKAFVRLTPRIPGRSVREGDVATATDQATNPSGYEATLPYTLTARSTGTSLNLDPGTRFEGPIWLRDRVQFYWDPLWSSSVRSTFLTEVGNAFGSTGNAATYSHPHPLNGPLRVGTTPTSLVQSDLTNLKTSWSTSGTAPTAPTFDAASWLTYRLYERGPTYQAVALSGTISNVTLRPTTSNPLGIFYREGSLSISSNVIIQGTLVVTSDISIPGTNVAICSYNWRDSNGNALISGADQWCRLPAIAARNISFTRDARVVIEGAVALRGSMTGAGGEFAYRTGTQVDISGTASTSRGQQPFSTIQLSGTPDLTSVTSGWVHAIWLANGSSGRWYPIHTVDRTTRRLTVVGEVAPSTSVSYRIRLCRDQFVDITGPTSVTFADIDRCIPWDLTSTLWDNRRSTWSATNTLLQAAGQPLMSFPAWLSNPANFSGYGLPYTSVGLPLEPTFHARLASGQKHLLAAPLFRPFVATTTSEAIAEGYRWKVVDWREEQ